MIRNSLYYGIKPLVPVQIRLAVRGWLTRQKRARFRDIWPILPGSEGKPKDWPGWPDGKKFAFVLTHDVEGPSGVAKCRRLMEVEKKYGFRSSFNFIPEGSYRISREFREEVARNGFEVSLHDLFHDGRLYRSRAEFARNAIRINQYLKEWGATGFRSGFMFHNLEWLQDLKIDYDASTFDTDPFEPQPDGTGTIFPFWHECAGGGGYVEIPYTLPQDSTLFLLLRERTPAIWMQKVEWIARHGGMALLNAHPDYMNFEGSRLRISDYPLAYYEGFLSHVAKAYGGSYWNPLPMELAAWFKRACVKPRPDGNGGGFPGRFGSRGGCAPAAARGGAGSRRRGFVCLLRHRFPAAPGSGGSGQVGIPGGCDCPATRRSRSRAGDDWRGERGHGAVGTSKRREVALCAGIRLFLFERPFSAFKVEPEETLQGGACPQHA